MNNPYLLDALASRGVLINVSVRYWRARKKLNAEDLGLENDHVNQRLISLGHKRLVPKDCLQSLALIEGRAHALVEGNTFPFLNGVARYLPNERLSEVNTKLDELRREFATETHRFLGDYSLYRQAALAEWRSTAAQLVDNPERLVAVIKAAFPEPEQMHSYFGFHVSVFNVAVPELPQAELVSMAEQAELIEARRQAAQEARHQIAASCDEFIRDCTSELRRQTAQLCSDMLTTINGTGSVHQKTLNRLVKFIDHFGELNFVNDTEMAQQLDKVKAEFLAKSAQHYRDSPDARDQLVAGLAVLRDRASALASADVSHLVDGFGKFGKRRFNLAA